MYKRQVYALASIGSATEGNAINIMKGYAIKSIEANFGTPEINGTTTRETWTRKNAAQVFLGATAMRTRTTADFLYDNDNLYFFARVVDREIYTDKIDNDGVYLYLDLNNACDTYPQEGEFRIFLNADGTVEWARGADNRWSVTDCPEGVNLVANVSKTYYQLEVAIPWKALGMAGPVDSDHTMRCNVEVRDRRSGALVSEPIPQTAKNASWTWPEFRLTKNPTGIETCLLYTSPSPRD